MDDRRKTVATACLDGAERNTMMFPEIVGALIEAGFEGYLVDFRRTVATYYLPDGDSVALPMHALEQPIAHAFDSAAVQAAIKEAQLLVPGYSYRGFCRKVTSAGCAGYMVSFAGRRAVYFGRTAETHVELFPD
jgi:uncharacterized protein YbcV (DUF1398 family)